MQNPEQSDLIGFLSLRTRQRRGEPPGQLSMHVDMEIDSVLPVAGEVQPKCQIDEDNSTAAEPEARTEG